MPAKVFELKVAEEDIERHGARNFQEATKDYTKGLEETAKVEEADDMEGLGQIFIKPKLYENQTVTNEDGRKLENTLLQKQQTIHMIRKKGKATPKAEERVIPAAV